jgi:hypothetical protein
VKLAPSRSAARARSAEANEAVRAILRGPVTFTQLALSCDTGREPSCRRTEALGTLSWRGLDFTLEFACVDDAVDAVSVSAQVARVKPFVDSKVLAAWNTVATGRRMLKPDVNAWRLTALWGLDAEDADRIDEILRAWRCSARCAEVQTDAVWEWLGPRLRVQIRDDRRRFVDGALTDTRPPGCTRPGLNVAECVDVEARCRQCRWPGR